jgi:hypothetical protein
MKFLGVFGVALILAGCGSSGQLTEIRDVPIGVPIPEKVDSTYLFWDRYVPPTGPAFPTETPDYAAEWKPVPTMPEGLRDTLSRVQAKLSRVLGELNALQGHIGRLNVTQKEKEIEIRYRDTTHYVNPPDVIETSWIEKIGIAAVGGIAALLLAGGAVFFLKTKL